MRTPKGYAAVRGDDAHDLGMPAHMGNDRADRWYIDTIGQPVDHRGPGHRTRREAVQMLVGRLDDIERWTSHPGGADAADAIAPERLAPDPCEVCGDASGRCRFARACSCWRGVPCA
jgi:hypothetical protein